MKNSTVNQDTNTILLAILEKLITIESLNHTILCNLAVHSWSSTDKEKDNNLYAVQELAEEYAKCDCTIDDLVKKLNQSYGAKNHENV